MADAPASSSLVSRRTLFWLAWILLIASLLMPTPSDLSVGLPFGISALYVYAHAVAWNQAVPGTPGSLGLLQVTILSLALFSHIAYLYTWYLRDDRNVSVAWKALLLVALAVDASIVFCVPELTRLPAFWVWLAAFATLMVGYVAFNPAGAAANPTLRDAPSEIDRGEVPSFVWVLLGATCFWIAISAATRAFPPPDALAAATGDSLTSYVNDRAHVLKADEVTRLTSELQQFEGVAPSQIAVALYPGAPGGAIDDFTIQAAERFPLGRAGLDNGAILFVFMDQRAARLEVGYGLEGALTDADSRRILDADLAPAFARGAYFDGLDATLRAIFANVSDAYKQDRIPGATMKWRRKLVAERPTKTQRIWRAITQASLPARIGVALLCTLVGLALWNGVYRRSRFKRAVGRNAAIESTVGQWGRLARGMGRGVTNLRAQRPLTEGIEAVDVGKVWDSVRLVAWTIGILIPAAGVILVAGGGEFGGAGALIHW